jgi:hypothetical protein
MSDGHDDRQLKKKIGVVSESSTRLHTVKWSDASFIAGADARHYRGCAAARMAKQRKQQVEDGSCTRNAAKVCGLGDNVSAVLHMTANGLQEYRLFVRIFDAGVGAAPQEQPSALCVAEAATTEMKSERRQSTKHTSKPVHQRRVTICIDCVHVSTCRERVRDIRLRWKDGVRTGIQQQR